MLGIFLASVVVTLEAFENLIVFYEKWRIRNAESRSEPENLASDRSKQ